MIKRIIILSLVMMFTSLAQGQAVESKKCKTCGKPLKECKYRGKHPVPTPKPKQEETKIESKYVRMDGDDIVFDLNGTEYRYRMVYVSGGSYTMGCKDEYDDDNRPNYEKEFERPAHNVTVDGFYIGQTEVTYALWCAVMRRIPDHYPKDWSSSYYSSNDFNLPVSFVSYDDCKEFIGKLNGLTGKVFRLPTENEWEYAARGGVYSHNYRYSGSDNRCSVTSCNGNVLPVAQKQSNELGLYDMSGNVSEWCDDLFRYYSGSELDPRWLPRIPCYVIRGGSCNYSNQYTHVSIRNYGGSDYYYWDIGFRLAR